MLACAVPKLEKSPMVPVNLAHVSGLLRLYVVLGAASCGRFQGRLCPSARKLSFRRSPFGIQLLVTKNCIHRIAGASSTLAPSDPIVYDAGYAKEPMLK